MTDVAETIPETTVPEIVAPEVPAPVDELALMRDAIAEANAEEGITPPEVAPEPEPEVDVSHETPDPNAEVLAEMAQHGIENPSTESVSRYKLLNDENKQYKAEVPMLKEKAEYWDAWEGHMTKIGATPEQVSELFSVAADINSRDPDRLTAVYEKLQQTLVTLGKTLGKPAPGFDPVAAYPDIQDEVNAGLPLTVAQELAERRTRDAYTQNMRQAQQQQYQQQTEQTRSITMAVEKLNTLGEFLEKSDPDYARKRAILEPTLKEAFAAIPPAHWETTFQRAYTALNLPKAEAPKPRPTLTHQPLRPAGGATSGNTIASKPPTDDIELMKWTLAQMK